MLRYYIPRSKTAASVLWKRNSASLSTRNFEYIHFISTKPQNAVAGYQGHQKCRFSAQAAAATHQSQVPSDNAINKPSPAADKKAAAAAVFQPTEARKYQFFTNVKINSDGVAIIQFDNPSKSVNTISFALKDEAKALWKQEIESNPSVRAVVFTSAKPNGFIAGADIHDIRDVEDKNQLKDMIKDGMDFFQQMKKKGIPLVCAINGPALGACVSFTESRISPCSSCYV